MFGWRIVPFFLLCIFALVPIAGSRSGLARELTASAPAASFGRASTSDLTRLPTTAPWRPGDPVNQVRQLRPTHAVVRGPRAPLDLHALVAPSGPSLLQRLTVRAGQGFNGAIPPDTVGAAGRSYFIQAVNVFGFDGGGAQIVIYNKSGQRLAGPILLSSLWPNPSDSCAQGLGDGVVVYDAAADRFIISQLPGDFSNFV